MNKNEIGILIVDDELIVRDSLTKWFKEDGFRVEAAENAAVALNKLQQNGFFTIMLVDIKMPGMDGIELLQRVREINKNIIVIIITAFASVDTAVKALKIGAYDYITKPIDPDYLDHLIEKALQQHLLTLENQKLKDTVQELTTGEIIGDSPEIKRVTELIQTVATTDTTVMIRGESGTGKELVARSIHHHSPRKFFPMVTVNCGAMTETLLESELFGHERGAFTGAQYRRKGKVELADGGTLFLDEIGNIDMKTQMDLLRVIETKEFTRVGGTEVLHSDFRVICATNRDLEKAVREGTFREDLYYRLNVFTIELPPLRGRRGDIARLAHHFLEKFSAQMNKNVQGFTPEAMLTLKAYDWPGNVRELENAIERAMVVTPGPMIDRVHLPLASMVGTTAEGKRLEDIERHHIDAVLRETGWNVSRSATILDIDRVTLYHKIEKYGLKREP